MRSRDARRGGQAGRWGGVVAWPKGVERSVRSVGERAHGPTSYRVSVLLACSSISSRDESHGEITEHTQAGRERGRASTSRGRIS